MPFRDSRFTCKIDSIHGLSSCLEARKKYIPVINFEGQGFDTTSHFMSRAFNGTNESAIVACTGFYVILLHKRKDFVTSEIFNMGYIVFKYQDS